MFMVKNYKKGFTLIELLVVIAIIGILSSVVLASLNTARQKSRDAKRISDLKQLQLALEFYFDANGSYPTALTPANLVTPGYIAAIPTDPVGGGSYLYAYNLAVPTSYHIGATLEDAGHTVLDSDQDCNSTAGTNCPTAAAYAGGGFDGSAAAVYDFVP
jgi:prepilin-type N-terminal cleavage/methylation domain-containing protein